MDSDALFKAAFDAHPVPAAILRSDGALVVANPAWRQRFGDRDVPQSVATGNGTPNQDGVRSVPLGADTVLMTCEAAATAEGLSAHELAALSVADVEIIISYDLSGRICAWNRPAERFYGYTTDEIIGQPMEVLFPDDWPYPISHYRDLIVAGELKQFEVIRKTRSGELRHISVTAATVPGSGGEVVAIANLHRDISRAKEREANFQFLNRELSHRTKNLLSVIAAIERQTAAGAATIDEFQAKFSARIKSLSQSNALLSRRNWAAAGLEEVVHSQLSIFADDPSDVADFGGPDLMLTSEAVQIIGMGLNELATNASKYGALSDHGGHISIFWAIMDDRLRLAWDEHSPGIRESPERRGMGHTVVTKLISRRLEADARLAFEPGRMIWRILIPQPHFRVNPPTADHVRD